MDPLLVWIVPPLLVSVGLGGFALRVAARAGGEHRRLARLAAVQLLEPLLTLGLFLGLRRLGEPPFGWSGSSEWAVLACGLTVLQLAPLLSGRSWSADAGRVVRLLGLLGLWRWLLSSVGIGALVLTSLLENPGAIAEISGLDNLMLVLAVGCLLAGVPLFLYAVVVLYHTLVGVQEALRTSPPPEEQHKI